MVRWLILSIVLAAASAAHGAADARRQLLGYSDSGSFWIEVPEGWDQDPQTSKRFGAIFVLRPGGTTFDSAPFVITASTFRGASIAQAARKDTKSFLERDPNMKITPRAGVAAAKGGTFTILDFRSEALRQQGFETAAYIQEEGSVLVFVFSAQTAQNYAIGYPAFEDLLRTFEVSDIQVDVHK